jgi:hypothetical protein
MNRIELVHLFQSNYKLGKGAEIGSFKGLYAKEILNIWTGKLYLVDVWRELSLLEYADSSNQKQYKNIIIDCCDSIKGCEDRCFMLRSDSQNGSELFDDESLDFVYIDANHRYEYVKQDISLWYPKVRKGGIVAGHDYLKLDWYADKSYANHPKDKHIWTDKDNNNIYDNYAGEFGVNPAVDEFCAQYNYELNLTEEWFSSWYFIK